MQALLKHVLQSHLNSPNLAPPSPPTNVTYSLTSEARIEISWTAQTNIGQTLNYFEITVNGHPVVNVSSSPYTYTLSLPGATPDSVYVAAVDMCGQKSDPVLGQGTI